MTPAAAQRARPRRAAAKKRRKKRVSVRDLSPDQIRNRVSRIARQLAAESPMKNEFAKRRLCEEVARLHVHLELVFEERLIGELDAEVARTLPAIASQILRHKKALGLTDARTEEDDEL